MAEKSSEKKHFVLVHGFCLGAWCWYKLSTLLKFKGHRVTALDLGGSGINPKQLEQISTVHDYLRPLTDFMSGLSDGENVILLGHSYGGIPVALTMEGFPEKISLGIFVTAYMPNCSDPPSTLIQVYFKRSSNKSFMDNEFTFNSSDGKTPVSAIFGPEYMEAVLYQNCPTEDLELGKVLIRPSKFFLEDLSKKSLLSEERYGSIKRCYVVCEDDEVMEETFQRYNIENSPPNDVVTIGGAAHMMMLSKAQELSFCLQELAEKY